MADQGWLWPSIKKAFFEDLARQAPRNGPWDVVVFTGDLTQAGLPAEYERLTSLLRELWDHFRGLGCNPFFLAVPGNHDLSRPDSQRAVVKVLKNFADDAEAQSTFWTNEANEYRIVITDAFKNYVEWWSRLSGLGIPIPYISYGILPGDFSAYVEVNGERTGFVGLNSAWLQLTNDRYKGRLHVDPRQIMGVTEGYPDEWLCQNEFNLLLTHHPVEWFSPACQLLWRSEIYIPDRFDCHLYGHMHEQLAVVSATWGSGGRRLIQAPSIFGLDKLGDGTTARCHGYSVLQTTKTEERKVIRLWPRIARPIQSGERRIVANVELGLENDSWTEISYQNQPKNGSSPPSTLAPQIQTLPSGDSLTQFRMSLRHVARTSAVRVVERDRALTALRGEGIFWLVSDWGMGGDEFLSSIGSELGIDLANVFALDLHPYRTFDEILSGVQEQAGCSFEMLCEAISVQPASLVILDDVAVGEPYETSSHPFESELERLARVMRQYCDNAMVVIRSRQRPSGCSLLEVELKPFDLADTAAYIRASELGGDQSSARGIAERFHDHTDGVPSRLDLALKHVKALGLSALHSTNTDVAGKSAVRKGQYKELELAIADLTNSENPSMKRAFLLLQGLSMFPRGEVLETVKRFDSVVVFYEQDALLLIERGFVDTVDMSGVRAADFMEHSRLLVVRRSVRDAIYESSTSEDLARLNSRALTSYFGGEWGAGRIKSRRGLHLDESGCADWQIGNANMLVLRAAKQAVDAADGSTVRRALMLANVYGGALLRGDHFRSLVAVCGELVPLLESFSGELDLRQLKLAQARGLRMCGNRKEACRLLESLVTTLKSTSERSSAYLNLALGYRSQKMENEAVDAARECMKIEPKSPDALQAKAIVITIASDTGEERDAKLRAAELAARKKNAHVVANNLALRRAEEMGDLIGRQAVLEEIIKFASDAFDFVNAMRAEVLLSVLKLKRDGALSDKQLFSLVGAFHYFYSEERGTWLDRANDALWNVFEASGEVDNLLRLFRHSSIVWRLRGRNELEDKYLKRIGPAIAKLGRPALSLPQREFQYYVARSQTSGQLVLQ